MELEITKKIDKETHCRLLDLSRGCEQYKMNLGGKVYRTFQVVRN